MGKTIVTFCVNMPKTKKLRVTRGTTVLWISDEHQRPRPEDIQSLKHCLWQPVRMKQKLGQKTLLFYSILFYSASVKVYCWCFRTLKNTVLFCAPSRLPSLLLHGGVWAMRHGFFRVMWHDTRHSLMKIGPLTVSPLCPGWPGSPSFPGGPWWVKRQTADDRHRVMSVHQYLNIFYGRRQPGLAGRR